MSRLPKRRPYTTTKPHALKALELIRKAASQGAKLIAFGETWIAGYPVWFDICPGAALWNDEPAKDVPRQLPHNVADKWVERGGSCILAPDSTYIVEPVVDRDELIITDLDLAMIDGGKYGS